MSDKYRIPDNALSDSEDEGTGGRRDRQSFKIKNKPGNTSSRASPIPRRALREKPAKRDSNLSHGGNESVGAPAKPVSKRHTRSNGLIEADNAKHAHAEPQAEDMEQTPHPADDDDANMADAELDADDDHMDVDEGATPPVRPRSHSMTAYNGNGASLNGGDAAGNDAALPQQMETDSVGGQRPASA